MHNCNELEITGMKTTEQQEDGEEVTRYQSPLSNELAVLVSDQRQEVQAAQGIENSPEQKRHIIGKCLCSLYKDNSFLILLLLAILVAYAYPPLGAKFLAPKITATWIAVIIIFFCSGIKLKSEELSKALQRFRFNMFVQLYNFFAVSSVVYGISRLMLHLGALNVSLADGLVISASVPITINMVLVLTTSSDGDEAAAIFNAAFGNLVGVFLSPALILMYLGVKGEVDVGDVFYKLILRVVLPLAIGQIFHKYSPRTVSFVNSHKVQFNKFQEYCLVFIVYTVFCRTFSEEMDTSVGNVFIMIGLVFFLLALMMIFAWFLLRLLFPDQPRLQVMGLFGCTHKSIAMGIPLINAIYEDNPSVGFYTLPLLVWHPLQLIIGSFLAPHLRNFVKTNEEQTDIHNGTAIEENETST